MPLYEQLSTYYENKILDHILATASLSMPSSVWLALYIEDPTDDDTGEEVSDSGYSRQEITFSPAEDGVATNSAAVTFGPFASSVNITHWGIRDAEVGGNLIVHGPLVDDYTLGDSSSQFDITKSGIVVTYTWDGNGTDPNISSTNPTPGDVVVISNTNFAEANSGRFVVIASGTNYFSVVNEDGVEESDKTIGSSGSIVRYTPTTAAMASRIRLTFDAGSAVVRLG